MYLITVHVNLHNFRHPTASGKMCSVPSTGPSIQRSPWNRSGPDQEPTGQPSPSEGDHWPGSGNCGPAWTSATVPHRCSSTGLLAGAFGSDRWRRFATLRWSSLGSPGSANSGWLWLTLNFNTTDAWLILLLRPFNTSTLSSRVNVLHTRPAILLSLDPQILAPDLRRNTNIQRKQVYTRISTGVDRTLTRIMPWFCHFSRCVFTDIVQPPTTGLQCNCSHNAAQSSVVCYADIRDALLSMYLITSDNWNGQCSPCICTFRHKGADLQRALALQPPHFVCQFLILAKSYMLYA